ncbi:MAG: response regulator [Planctomycetes bacterium]|jgi:DNA-binding NtrC family response regulator|nr:response regulator [Planctomycetota bacterium]
MDKKTVLFVDDDPFVLETLKVGLIGEPYERLFANSAHEALQLLETERVHIVVSDLRMPEMNGLELLQIIRQKWPSVFRIVLSGQTQVSTLLHAINNGHIYKFIVKPWALEDDFKPAIREALKYVDTPFLQH